jgi:hypothetical protein
VRIGKRGRRLLARQRRPTVIARVRYESLAGGMRTVERRYRLRG